MATEEELWNLVKSGREGILVTIGAAGRPQLSNILYLVDPDARMLRITTTADRVKARNLARDPRASLHVSGEDFWHFAVADGTATLSDVATTPGDDATHELKDLYRAFFGEIDDEASFFDEMIANRRLVVRMQVDHLYGLLVER
jgi:PPOX class probable F420-dependent enzyme